MVCIRDKSEEFNVSGYDSLNSYGSLMIHLMILLVLILLSNQANILLYKDKYYKNYFVNPFSK